MENDDRPVGRILTRREALALLGTAGAALLAACLPGQSGSPQPTSGPAPTLSSGSTPAPTSAPVQATSAADTVTLPACIVRPEVTEGPYFADEMLNRSDIRSDPGTGAVKDGALLVLTFNLSQVTGSGCTPLAGAQVDIWHCDAAGAYSDVSDPGFNTAGQKFLRGYQVTDANGQATFATIYPGWYSSRAVHIHFKVRLDPNYEFTSQLFFDEALTDQVHAQSPYASKGQRDTLNSTDNIYDDRLLLAAAQTDQGYATTFDLGLQMA
jgi:protocatechuate 3,4-dioxygenase beta subunit